VVLPRGNVARGKLVQAALHGAEILAVEGYFDRALSLVVDYGTKWGSSRVDLQACKLGTGRRFTTS
jgi:L-threonine synthase (EC 4.2.3.1)